MLLRRHLLVLCLSGCAAAPSEPQALRRAISADGVGIVYRIQGQGSTAVVLVHGWACNASYWREQVAALAERYTVVTLDLAGHGGSGAERSDWSITRFGDDIAAVVRELPQQKVVLVGHSMGGPAVVAAAAKLALTQRVVGLIGVDTLKNIGLPPPPASVRQTMVGAFEQDFAGTMRKNVIERMFRPTSNVQLVQRVADGMARMPAQRGLAMLGGLFKPEWEAHLPALKVPLVAINSDLGGRTDDQHIRNTAPTFRSITLPGAGHFVMLEEPQRFNAVLLQQLSLLAP